MFVYWEDGFSSYNNNGVFPHSFAGGYAGLAARLGGKTASASLQHTLEGGKKKQINNNKLERQCLAPSLLHMRGLWQAVRDERA